MSGARTLGPRPIGPALVRAATKLGGVRLKLDRVLRDDDDSSGQTIRRWHISRDWFGLVLAIALCVAIPFLQAAERRERRRDEARRDAIMAQARTYCLGLLADVQRKDGGAQ